MSLACDILIIGAGPAGLSAAGELRRAGVGGITILEREQSAGGIPRHCGHRGFGLPEYGRLWRGPDYARRLATEAAGLDLKLGWSALRLQAGGLVEATGPRGLTTIQAKRVLLALGARETPRSQYLVGGTRPTGVMNAATLQQSIYLEDRLPCRRPVVIGSELVAFSTLLTLAHKGARPIAIIEENPRITARRPGDWIARLSFGVPVLTGTRLLRILGRERVEGVEIDRGAGAEILACDGVVFSGRFRPEAGLLAGSGIARDTGSLGPSIDPYWRTSDPACFAAGNGLRGIETAGRCWREGRAAARAILADLAGRLPAPAGRIPVEVSAPLKYAYPQHLYRDRIGKADGLLFKARVTRAAKGRLSVLADGREIWSRAVSALPERRIAWRAPATALRDAERVTISLVEG